MPTPKSGTVTDNIQEAITAVKAGRVEFKNGQNCSLAVVVGKGLSRNLKLEENAGDAVTSSPTRWF